MRIYYCIILILSLILTAPMGCKIDKNHEELRKAVATKKKGHIQEAIAMYTKLVDNGAFVDNPHNRSILFYNRGIAFSDLQDYPAAVDDFSRAIALSPEFITSYHNRSIVYEKMGDLERSIADIQRILQLEPQDSDAQKRLRYLQDKLNKQ